MQQQDMHQQNLQQQDLQQRQHLQQQHSQSSPGVENERSAFGDVYGDSRRNLTAGGIETGGVAPRREGVPGQPKGSLQNDAQQFPGLMGPNVRPFGGYPMPGRPHPAQMMQGHQIQQHQHQPDYPLGFPASESSMRHDGEPNPREMSQSMLQQRNCQIQQQLQQRLHHERLHQERMEQERMLRERQQLLASQGMGNPGPMPSVNSSNLRAEQTPNFG